MMDAPRFNRQMAILSFLAAAGDILYRVTMGVLYGLAVGAILYPFWSN